MKKKYFITSLFALLLFGSLKAQTTLAAGEVVISGFNADNPDQFSFVLLTDVVATTTINFTDRGWQAAGGLRNFEGIVTWTADSDLFCGTEIIIENVGTNLFSADIGTAVSTDNGFALSGDGDQILVYQGVVATPTFIFAINFSSFGWSDATSANDSALPVGLTDGTDAIDVGNFDDGAYNCATTSTAALTLITTTNVANWNLSDMPLTLGACSYSCCPGGSTVWNGTTWSMGVPDMDTAAIINDDYDSATDGGSFTACSLNVNTDDVLRIQGTDFVSVQGDIFMNGEIIVSNEASLVQIDDYALVTLGGAAANGVVQKTANPQEYFSYTYWSSPFTAETIGEVGSGLDLVPSQRIFEYNAANFIDADADGFDDNSNDWNIATGPMVLGKGYAAFAQNNGLGFPQAQTYSFDGEFNNGIITTPIAISAGAGDPNWNLIGNPYPSGLNADVFLSNTSNATVLDGTIYLWTHNSPPDGGNQGPNGLNFSVDDYASYTPGSGGVAAITGGAIPTGIIASGQGFFIEALASAPATPTALFNNAMRVNTGNDDFFRATDRIWLNLENDFGAFSQILVTFSENATNGLDRLYDGKRLDAGSYISFFSMIDDEHYAIQGREALTEEEIVPLGIKNLVEGENAYKISIDTIEGLLENSEVYLIDNAIGVTHDLNTGAYTFSSDEGVFKERFELKLINTLPVNPLVEDELLIAKQEDNTVVFSTTNNSEIINIQLFDILGRQLYNIDVTEQETPYTLNALNNTIFIVRATLSDGKVLSKKGLK